MKPPALFDCIWCVVTFILFVTECKSLSHREESHILQIFYHVILKRDVNATDNTETSAFIESTTSVFNGSSAISLSMSSAAKTQTPSSVETTTTQIPTTTIKVSNVTTDNHLYYQSKILMDPGGNYWDELQGHTRHHLSNDRHLMLSYVTLSFMFPFYGHNINYLALTTQGFIYMHDFTHQQLDHSYTFYLAPLMANFDTIGADSEILYLDDGNKFVAEWRNVALNDQKQNGNYTFQTTLFKNGTILFAYQSVPETNISDTTFPVKVGISDGFFLDLTTVFGVYRFLFKYHNVSFEPMELRENSVIILDPLPTCNIATSCEQCTNLNTTFSCSWCHAISKCSGGYDRHRQTWTDSNCNTEAVSTQDLCSSKQNGQTSTSTPVNPDVILTNDDLTKADNTGESKQKEGAKKFAMIVVPMLTALGLIIIFTVGFVSYARSRPNSKAGRWMIEHRPKKLRERLTRIQFFKSTPGTSDNVRITSDSEPPANTSSES